MREEGGETTIKDVCQTDSWGIGRGGKEHAT